MACILCKPWDTHPGTYFQLLVAVDDQNHGLHLRDSCPGGCFLGLVMTSDDNDASALSPSSLVASV